jgi:hypothetical protein
MWRNARLLASIRLHYPHFLCHTNIIALDTASHATQSRESGSLVA